MQPMQQSPMFYNPLAGSQSSNNSNSANSNTNNRIASPLNGLNAMAAGFPIQSQQQMFYQQQLPPPPFLGTNNAPGLSSSNGNVPNMNRQLNKNTSANNNNNLFDLNAINEFQQQQAQQNDLVAAFYQQQQQQQQYNNHHILPSQQQFQQNVNPGGSTGLANSSSINFMMANKPMMNNLNAANSGGQAGKNNPAFSSTISKPQNNPNNSVGGVSQLFGANNNPLIYQQANNGSNSSQQSSNANKMNEFSYFNFNNNSLGGLGNSSNASNNSNANANSNNSNNFFPTNFMAQITTSLSNASPAAMQPPQANSNLFGMNANLFGPNSQTTWVG